jgi:hypothetical protein
MKTVSGLLLLAVLLISCGATREDLVVDSLLRKEQKPFAVDTLLELAAFGDFDIERDFNSRFLMLIHINQLTCRTCKMRELKEIKKLMPKYTGKMDVILVAQGTYTEDFRRLRKIGLVDFPILREPVQGYLGLKSDNHFQIAFIDKNTRQLIWAYYPDSAPETAYVMHEFEKRIEQYMNSQT